MINTHVREVGGEWKVVLTLVGVNGFAYPDLSVGQARDIVRAASDPPIGFSSSCVYNIPRWGNGNVLLGVDVWIDRVQVDPLDVERLRRMLGMCSTEPVEPDELFRDVRTK